jgi:UDP-2,4-diacetamido-2,4,6-trideoxy-beta-L-altropyranose hydrolase
MMTRTNQPLLFRADASPRMGIGHVMRCLALAQAWCDAGGSAVFLAAELPPALADRLRQEGVPVVRHAWAVGSEEDAKHAAALACELGADWIIADGYAFSQSWQYLVKQSGARLLLYDDGNRTGGGHADLILDANLRARPEDYAGSPAHLLLGPRFVLLRREFLRRREWQRDTSSANRILVTLGGADAGNVTLRILRTLGSLPGPTLEIAALLGPANSHHRDLQAFAASARRQIALHADPPDVAAWMAWADVAVAAGGTTMWERAFMSLPSLTLVLADNQTEVAHAANEAGITRDLGPAAALDDKALSRAAQEIQEDEPTRARMAQRGRELVDGDGVERVLMHLTGADMRLRPARNEDAELLWRWANDPTVRRASFTERLIPWGEHLQWFARKRQELGCLMFIGVDANDAPLGQVRIDGYPDGEAEIHVSVAGERRGQGWGGRLLRAAVERAGRELRTTRIHAHIKPDNGGSMRAFQKAGFQDMGSVTRAGLRVRHALYVRETA